MSYTHLSQSDYDDKLREMGNYLWDLEQRADLASGSGHQQEVTLLEVKITQIANRAHSFSKTPGPHYALAIFVAALGYRMTRQWQTAADLFQELVNLNPENGEAWLELTWCLAELAQWENCLNAAKRSTDLFPKAAASWGNLALALNRMNRKSEALSAMQKAIQCDPQDPRNRMILKQIEASP